MTAQFGPSALATPANGVTIGRLVLTLPLLLMVLDDGASWSAVVLWILLCITDGIDGHLARRQGTFWWLPAVLIAVRELGIQGFRSFWGRRGLAVPASGLAKVKTVMQEVAVGLALVPIVADDAMWLATTVLWGAVVLTVVTGVQYVVAGSRAATTSGSLPK